MGIRQNHWFVGLLAGLLGMLTPSLPACVNHELAPPPENEVCLPVEERRYEAPQVDYFLDIALGTEFGGSSRVVRKWREQPTIRIHGSPTAEDSTTIRQVVEDVNGITGGLNALVVSGEARVNLHVVPESDFEAIEPNYVPGNAGFFWVNWTGNDEIFRATILISTGVSQRVRNHLLREELTQSLGLMNDSPRYPESIFYQNPSTTDTYAAIDSTLIEMLYRNELRPGMTRDVAGDVLCGIAR